MYSFRPMVFGLKNGLIFESQYILSTMSDNGLSGETESLRLNINAIENTQSTSTGGVQQENQLPIKHRTPLNHSNLLTSIREQVEYPDNISRKRKLSPNQLPQKKGNSVNSNSVIEQFREECLEDDALLSQVVDFHVNDAPNRMCTNSDGNSTLGITGHMFARCYTLPARNSPKKGKVIVYDSDGLESESD